MHRGNKRRNANNPEHLFSFNLRESPFFQGIGNEFIIPASIVVFSYEIVQPVSNPGSHRWPGYVFLPVQECNKRRSNIEVRANG